jgi:hypothetical protein
MSFAEIQFPCVFFTLNVVGGLCVPYSMYLHNYQVCASSGVQQLMLISVSLRPCLQHTPFPQALCVTDDTRPRYEILADTDAAATHPGNLREMLGETASP